MRDFLDRAPADDAVRRGVDDGAVPGFRIRVLFLDEEPCLVARFAAVSAAARSHQHEAALELLAVERELELAFPVARDRIALGIPRAAIPYHHGTAAVFAFRYDAFESTVLDRMILDVHRETLVGGIETRTFRNGPAQQDAALLQAKIVMKMACRVLLHDKRASGRLGASLAARRLRRPTKIALRAIGLERHAVLRAGDERLRALAPCSRAASRLRGPLARGFGAADDM